MIIVRATPSAAGPWLLAVAIWGTILASWGTFSAPREHPGGPFWHFGTSWRIKGATGQTRGGWLQDFIRFWDDFGTFVWELLGHRGSNFLFFIGLVSRQLVL